MIDHTVHTQDLLAENSSVAAINFPGQISAQSVDEHPSSFRLFDVSATAPAILGDEKTNLNVLSDSSSDDPEVSTLLTDENISGTIMNSHPKPLLTSKYGKTQPVVLTRNSIMCEEDEKPYVSNGDDDDDAGNNSDSSIELSNTNPFKQELLQSLQDEDTINPEVNKFESRINALIFLRNTRIPFPSLHLCLSFFLSFLSSLSVGFISTTTFIFLLLSSQLFLKYFCRG